MGAAKLGLVDWAANLGKCKYIVVNAEEALADLRQGGQQDD